MSSLSKTKRYFECRDTLWTAFETMSEQLDCSVDYLINDAMKQYARQRGMLGRGPASKPGRKPTEGAPPSASGSRPTPAAEKPAKAPEKKPAAKPPEAKPTPRAAASPAPPPAPASPSGGPPPPPPRTSAPPPPPPPGASAGAPPPLPPPKAGPPKFGGAPSGPPPPARPPIAKPSGAPSSPPADAVTLRPPAVAAPPPRIPSGPRPPGPPPLPGGGITTVPSTPRSSVPPPLGGEPERKLGSLAVACEGTRVQISKPRFVIGRGKQSTDLTIKDPNVSRQHAMVEFVNGRHYIVDMGSTNGIMLEGSRVERRLINDGDMFQICDHTLVFMFD